jgi:hypothetical protein
MNLPDKVNINAYAPDQDEAGSSAVTDEAELWALRNRPPKTLTFLVSEEPPDLRDWQDPRVGWGLIVLDDPNCKGKDAAELADLADDPIFELWEARGRGPVFRYNSDREDRLTLIHSARDDTDVLLRAGPPGMGPGALPRYVLIYGGPERIPWDVQYALQQNKNCFVGRLPFVGPKASNYVKAVASDFKSCPAKKESAIVWASVWPEEGESGITRLMRDVVAKPVYERMTADKDLKPLILDGANREATADRMLGELAARNPALLLTTSHGQTGPLGDATALAASLGFPLDQSKKPVGPEDILKQWNPGGAIWYAHACCSAGSDHSTNFDGLLSVGTSADRIVKAVAALDSQVSPMPLKLLQLEQPLRAFIGHVEPTFDLSLVHFKNLTPATNALQEALYNGLYRAIPEPIGLAMRRWYNQIGEMLGIFDDSFKGYNKGDDAEMTPVMIWSLLAARDLKTTVILGDPAVSLPA